MKTPWLEGQGEFSADYLLEGLFGVLFFDPEDFFAGAFVVFLAAGFFFVAIFNLSFYKNENRCYSVFIYLD
jgi:hypothetical protein